MDLIHQMLPVKGHRIKYTHFEAHSSIWKWMKGLVVERDRCIGNQDESTLKCVVFDGLQVNLSPLFDIVSPSPIQIYLVFDLPLGSLTGVHK